MPPRERHPAGPRPTKRPAAAPRPDPTTVRRAASERRTFERWLLELTSLPTAAGREDRVVAWIERWAAQRKDLRLGRDRHGNLLITRAARRGPGRAGAPAPIWFQAHLDHPAFVVRSVGDDGVVELEFRGGVHDPYFVGAELEILDGADRAVRATIVSLDHEAKPFKIVKALPARASRRAAEGLVAGDVGRWRLPKARITDGLLHTHGCDDLAAVAAALAAFERLRSLPGAGHVGVLLTRSEEIGFIGTIGAARDGTVPRDSRIICLENSRSFAESPIGAGPIVRVGDRRSVFTPELTNRIGDVVAEHQKARPAFRYQRKLMPGGTCEATAFASYGYLSTCLCLPLGNYHNMVDIDGVLAGARPARVGPEHVSVNDFHGLVEMLEVIVRDLDGANVPPPRAMMDKLWTDLSFVLGGNGR